MILGDQHTTEKGSFRNNAESASAASTHSPPIPEEKCLESKMVNHNNEPIKGNNMQNSLVQKEFNENKILSTERALSLNNINKLEDCNSSRESIDVETTQTEDLKPFASINTTPASTETNLKNFAEPLKEHNSVKQEEGTSPPIDWSIYHLGDMALDVWLQTVRKHIVLALIRHPKYANILILNLK